MGGKTPESAPGDLSSLEFLRLLAGDRALRKRLEAGERLHAVTPLSYPGRYGPVAIDLALVDGPSVAGKPPSVRLSENGDLLKSLDEQGMDLTADMILSKTVFHAVKEVEGAGIAGGLVFLDSDLDNVPADVWRFLQLIAEIIGLRHSKYKDALVRLSRRQEGPELIDWGGR